MVFRIFKIIATSGFLTALEGTKFVFGGGSAPNPAGGATAVPQTLSCLKSPTSKGGEGKERGRGLEGNGMEREGPAPYTQIPGSALEASHSSTAKIDNENPMILKLDHVFYR